jgi:hypothetical protein
MIDEDIELYFDRGDGSCYLESLAKTASTLSAIYSLDSSVMSGMYKVLELEIELATVAAEKARQEVLKDRAKTNIKAIK